MRVFVTGATGLVGRALVPELIRHGHDVVGLARTIASRSMLHAMRAVACSGQGADVELLSDALSGVHAIVHLATGIPANEAAVEDEWPRKREVIVGMLANLLEASERSGVRTVIFPGFYGVYGDHGDEWVTEETPLAPDKASRPFAEAEELLLRSTEARRSIGVILRLGMVYAADALHTRGLLYGLRRGQIAIRGDGRMYWPQLHVEDAAQAIRLALERSPAGEIFNICDNEPVRQSELYRHLAAWAGGPPLPSDTGPLSPYLGSLNLSSLSLSVRMSNRKAKAKLGFKPRYPTYREGYRAIIEEWKREGTD
ncbi:MAG TPA: NAD(P)-dependent oxidoreductase [Chloroflexi bacterium]|nr:NAD(P)-dependent oxidoreductase [Chloroflexota bacterium]